MMTIEDIIEIEIKYLSLFCNQKKRASGLIFYDENQKDKYDHNLMMINSDHIELSELKQYEKRQYENGFVKFRLEKHNHMDFLFLKSYEISKYGYFYSAINDLNVQPKINANIKIIDPNHDEDFFKFMHLEDLPYSLSYADGNVKRQKDILKTKKDQYIYLGLKYQEKYIGHLNACISDKFAKIDEFYVIEDFQKQGYGTKLMSYMLNELTLRGVEEVYLVTDLADTAKELYLRYGFHMVGTYQTYFKSMTSIK